MVRTKLVEIFRRLVKEKGVEILEGNLRKDHVHMVLSIPPKYSISMIIGFLKGKSAILIHRELGETKHGLYGKNFWARGYFVSSIGADEEVVKEYVRKQEYIEKRNPTQQLDLGLG